MADSDDDVPVSQLIRAKEQEAAAVASKAAASTQGDNGNSTSEKATSSNPALAPSPAPVPVPKPSIASSGKSGAGGSSSDSEEDLPIADLMKRRNRLAGGSSAAVVAKKPKTEPSRPDSKDKDRDRDSKPKSSSSSAANTSGKSTGGRVMSDDSAWGAFYNTSKGMLVQRLLCRWWYAVQWPKLDEIGPVPAGYESLEGYPGVYVSTRTDSLGTILDLRNKSNSPCLTNFAKMSATMLRELCITAYEKQMERLTETEGSDAKLLQQLKSELKEIKQVNVEKADKEGRKYENSFKV